MNENNNAQVIADLARQGMDVKEINGIPHVVVPDGVELQSLDHLAPCPQRKTGALRVQDLESFLHVFNIHKNASTALYADREHGEFKAIFNDNTGPSAGWKDHACVYRCPKSNEWNTWQNNNNRKMSQEEFARFIEQNLIDISEPTSSEILEISRSLIAKKSVNFKSSLRLSNGANQFVYEEEIKGTTQGGNLEVPEEFKIGIQVFLNGDAYEVTARLRYRIKDERLEMWYELDRSHKIYEDAFNNIATRIAEETSMFIINADL